MDDVERLNAEQGGWGPSPSPEQWEALIEKEQSALANYDGRMKMLYGDSNTHAPFEIYARGSDDVVLNQAITGDTTTGILRRIRQMDVVDNPGVAMLSGGTNDLKNYYGKPPHEREGSPSKLVADIIQNKRDSVQALRQKNPNAEIRLASILPSDERIPQSVLTNVNRQIEALAEEMGVGFVDPYTPMARPRRVYSGR